MTTNPVLLPISAVIPTRHRPGPLQRTLESLGLQSAQPSEIVVVDASDDEATEKLCGTPAVGLRSKVYWHRARQHGAGAQRNEALSHASEPFISFMDDDIVFEPECMSRLWAAMQADPSLGGVVATITNLQYSRPGLITRHVFPLLAGRKLPTYAGRVMGPAVNVVADDCPELPEVVPVDWLGSTLALYRRDALPSPPFDEFFTGYSLMEDVTLSLRVGRRWKLANARTARIFHDSQPGDHKRSHVRLAEMELVNRHYVMTKVLGRAKLADYLKLALWEAFQVAALARRGPKRIFEELIGKARGVATLSGILK